MITYDPSDGKPLALPSRSARPQNAEVPAAPLPQPSPPISASDLPTDILLPRLRGVVESSHQSWSARCPAHGDSRPSLSLKETKDLRLLIYCHAGCTAEEILAAVGLELRHLFPSSFAVFRAPARGRRQILPSNSSHVASPLPMPAMADFASVRNFTDQAELFHQNARTANLLQPLGQELGIPESALADFRVGFAHRSYGPMWVFPERDCFGTVVGLVYRHPGTGEKTCEPGSKRGLAYAPEPPPALQNPTAPVYLAEGLTDAIAVHGLGGLAIGRPAAALSPLAAVWLEGLLMKIPYLGQRRIVVVGDADRAGRLGADSLLGWLASRFPQTIPFVAFPPAPFKDLREFILSNQFQLGWPVT